MIMKDRRAATAGTTGTRQETVKSEDDRQVGLKRGSLRGMGKKKTAVKARRPAKKARERKGGLKDFCRSLPGTTEDIKWGDHHAFSVGKKMYAGFGVDDETVFGFKCSEEDQLRLVQIEGIIPAPYAAKWGWVLVEKRGVKSDEQWRKYLRKSYELVLAGLPKRIQAQIAVE